MLLLPSEELGVVSSELYLVASLQWKSFSDLSFLFTHLRPSDAFLAQLEIFGAAKYRVSHKDRATREFYRDRVVTEVLSELFRLPSRSRSRD